MAWTDFYMQTTGNNLNSGTTNADTSPYTSTAGAWSTSTNVFTPADGQTTNTLVSVGDWISLYPAANSITPFIAQVTVVGTGVNGTITVSTTARYGTAPTTGTVNCKRGGAWASPLVATASFCFAAGTIQAPLRVNIKAGTYAMTTTITAVLAGTGPFPIWFRGYKTTPGDQEMNNIAVAGTDIPSITFTTGYWSGSAYNIYSNIDFIGATVTASRGVFYNANSNVAAYACRFTNTAVSANGVAVWPTVLYAVRCWMNTTSSAPNLVSTGSIYLIGCVFTGGSTGIGNTTATIQCTDCVFDGIGGNAITSTTGNIWCQNCSFSNCLGHGISSTFAGAGIIMIGCHFENLSQASKYCVSNSSGTNNSNIRMIGCSYNNCTGYTLGVPENFYYFDVGNIASPGFQSGAGHNFTPNSILWGNGFPKQFENVSLYQGYKDNGAVQHTDTVGGGGATSVAY